MKKICKVCNDDFVGHPNRKYCSSQCQEEARIGVLLPDIDRAYKHQLKNIKGNKWSSKCYNLTSREA